VLPRFITRTHELSSGRERWRTGVVLADDGAEALVKADYDANRISVWVREGHADARRALLKVVRHHFDRIHGRIKDLVPEELVALPGHPEVLVRYLDLILDERRRKETVPVTIAGERVDKRISEFLNGVESAAERKKALERMERTAGGKTINLAPHAEYHEHHEPMNQDSHDTNIGRDNLGQAGQTLTNCTNMIQQMPAGEPKELLEKLLTQIEPLREEMKGKDFKVLEEHLEKLTEEAKKPEPDRGALSLSGQGLIEAAETVGKIATPVLTTVGLLLKFFGVPLP
jgi:DNA-binding FrmR family transcriptional regulator